MDYKLEYEKLLAAVKKHHQQRSDDRCWMDDYELYKEAGLPSHDPSVGNGYDMLLNCVRFVRQRCTPGGWPTYAQLEGQIAQLKQTLVEKEQELQVLRQSR